MITYTTFNLSTAANKTKKPIFNNSTMRDRAIPKQPNNEWPSESSDEEDFTFNEDNEPDNTTEQMEVANHIAVIDEIISAVISGAPDDEYIPGALGEFYQRIRSHFNELQEDNTSGEDEDQWQQ
ncbi:hypothetical protein ACOME3_006742 [Neoechinorhynchus agilis]